MTRVATVTYEQFRKAAILFMKAKEKFPSRRDMQDLVGGSPVLTKRRLDQLAGELAALAERKFLR